MAIEATALTSSTFYNQPLTSASSLVIGVPDLSPLGLSRLGLSQLSSQAVVNLLSGSQNLSVDPSINRLLSLSEFATLNLSNLADNGSLSALNKPTTSLLAPLDSLTKLLSDATAQVSTQLSNFASTNLQALTERIEGISLELFRAGQGVISQITGNPNQQGFQLNTLQTPYSQLASNSQLTSSNRWANSGDFSQRPDVSDNKNSSRSEETSGKSLLDLLKESAQSLLRSTISLIASTIRSIFL